MLRGSINETNGGCDSAGGMKPMRKRTSLLIAIAAFTFMTWGVLALQTQKVDDRASRTPARMVNG